MNFIVGLGYLLFSLLFIGSGFTKLADPQIVAEGIRRTRFYSLAIRNGVPLDVGDNLVLFVVALGASMIICSIMFALGVFRRAAAVYLSLCVVAFSYFVHLNIDAPEATDANNIAHILKNLAIAGAMLVIAFSSQSSETKTQDALGNSNSQKRKAE